jgi:mannose-1-phosphate guanylyltransferase
MVLAAGLGTRLRPFTGTLPKPLLPIANRPLLEYTFSLLARAEIAEVMVNTHHLAEVMEEGLRRLDSAGLRLHTSREKKILGTAGGPKKAAPFLEGGTFLLVNGDFLIDIDLREAVAFHRRSGARATMVLREEAGGAICTDGEGRIRQFLEPQKDPEPSWTRCGFTGIHILEPDLLKLIPANTPWEINRQVYPEMIERGWPVFGYLHRGYWREAGDPRGYLAANLELLTGRAGAISLRPGSGSLDPPGGAVVAPALVGEGVILEEGARIGPRVIVGPGARIGRGARISGSVVLEGTDVPEGAVVADEIRSPEGTLETLAVDGGKGGEVL